MESFDHANTPSHRAFVELYKPLDSTLRQIRVIRLESGSGPVRCTLTAVSLNDWADDFADLHGPFEQNIIDGRTRQWLENAYEGPSHPVSASHTIAFPEWRWREFEPTWTALANVFGIKPAGEDPRESLRPVRLALAPLSISSNEPLLQNVEENPTMSIPARFKWGDYEAISYRCGSEDKPMVVYVNGIAVRVTQNLYDALLRVRALPEAPHIYFWVDALSIAQHDIVEKNQQVSFMRDIFCNALAVVAYLGNGNENTSRAIEAIVQNYWLEVNSISLAERSKWALGLPWEAILEFLTTEYFERLRVIQELALCHRMTLLLCGDRVIIRPMLQMMAVLARDMPQKIWKLTTARRQTLMSQETLVVQCAQPIFDLAERVESILRMSSYPGNQASYWPQGLTQVLDLAQKVKSKYPQDKIYGMTALLDSQSTIRTTVDFSKSAHEVYDEFAVSLLSEYGLRYVLSWCSSSIGAKHRSRSWIPNWDRRFPRKHVRQLNRQAAGAVVHKPVVGDDMKLACRGIIADTLATLSAPPTKLLPYAQEDISCYYEIEVDHQPNRYGTKEAVASVLFHTMLMNQIRKTYFSDDGASIRHQESLTLFDNICWLPWDSLQSKPGAVNDLLDSAVKGVSNTTTCQTWEYFDRFRQSNASFRLYGYPLKSFFPVIKDAALSPKPQRRLSDKEIDDLVWHVEVDRPGNERPKTSNYKHGLARTGPGRC